MTQSRMRYAPVVLAIASVPMNGAIFPRDEMRPADWIGKPITIDHPKKGNAFVSATERDAIGEIVNAWIDGDKLKGTIKVDVSRAPRHLLDRIEREDRIDVSTGYLANEECPASGLCIHRNIRPDHLAVVPTGACSWADGCGIRSHMKVNHVTKTRFQSSKRRYSNQRPSIEESLRDALEDALSPLTAMIDQLADGRVQLDEFKRNCSCHTTPVANRSGDPAALKAMSTHGLAGADFHMRANERKRMSDEYIRRNPVQRQSVVTNSNDPAVQAMSTGGLLANLKKGA